jgi:acid phosphatase type 7
MLLVSVACADNVLPQGPQGFDGGRFEGGERDGSGHGVACTHDVVTRPGAEAPVRGGDVLGDSPHPWQIHLGLVGDPRTSIAILWRTDEATTATTVRFGVAGRPLDRTVEGITFRYATGDEMIRVHETHLCGLAPDTEYEYQVGGAGVFSRTHRFRTAPDVATSPDAEVVVGYFGDSRGGWDVLARIGEQLAARSPDLLVATGDLVNWGDRQIDWERFFAAAPDLFASVPLIVANGNHEGNAVNFYSLLAMPGDEENFSFDYGHLHQVVVNTDPDDLTQIQNEIAEFLDEDLARSTARWNVVAMHKSMWSSSLKHGSNLTRRTAWGRIMDAHRVDLVFSGHDHLYERTRPMRGETAGATPADGTIYIVSGGAGAPLYGVPDSLPYFSEIAESSYNATVISFRRDSLAAETFRDDGSPLDTFLISK